MIKINDFISPVFGGRKWRTMARTTLALALSIGFSMGGLGCGSSGGGGGGESRAEAGLAHSVFVGPPEWLGSFDAAWQRIQDSHFDPDFNGVDWNQVRVDMRPRAEAATSENEIRSIIREMLAQLEQSHFELIPREVSARLEAATEEVPQVERQNDGGDHRGGAVDETDFIFGEFGFDLRVINDDILVVSVKPGGPAANAGVKPGWILYSVDGETFDDLLDETTESGISHRILAVHLYRAILTKLVGPINRETPVQFIDGTSQPVTLKLRAEVSDTETIQFGNLPELEMDFHAERLPSRQEGNGIGYLRFNIWMAPLAAKIDRAIDEYRGCEGIIIDLRGNPGGLGAMVMGVSGHFLDTYEELGEMRTRSGTLQFRANPRRVNHKGKRVVPFAGPLAILMDDLSGSTSEIFAACLQDVGRARVFGQQSVGAALPAMTFELPNGDILLHAVGDFVTASGRSVEGDGVIPDVVVDRSRSQLLKWGDPSLDAARKWIEAQTASSSGNDP